MNNVVVVDYGLGNLFSVHRSLEMCGASVEVSSDPKIIASAPKVVLPGVGAFSNAMEELSKLRLINVLRNLADEGTPFLGICLGMQLLMEVSEEFGNHEGLGIVPGQVIHIPKVSKQKTPLKVPHIGWNELIPKEGKSFDENSILSSINFGDAVYFVHSYMAVPKDSNHCIAHCKYGEHSISAVIKNKNVTGCQFHPEKSGEVGLKILKEFCQS